MREKYINNIRKIFSGDVADYSKSDNIKLDSGTMKKNTISDDPSGEEMQLRKEIEKQDKKHCSLPGSLI